MRSLEPSGVEKVTDARGKYKWRHVYFHYSHTGKDFENVCLRSFSFLMMP